LRTETRALAINRRSIDANRRLKMLADGAKVAEAVLDILVPFFEGSEALRDHLRPI
jgi:hypothetical protein